MPLDTTVSLYVRELALRHSVTLSQARRMLIEQIDLTRRHEVSEATRNTQKGVKKVEHENPFRTLVSPSDLPIPTVVKKYSEKKKRMKSETETPGSRKPVKPPAPGTDTSIIYGELTDSEKDFNQAYLSLRNMHRFDYLTERKLKQRMYNVSWKYEIPVKKVRKDSHDQQS